MEDVSEDGGILATHIMPLSNIKKGLTYFEKDDVLVAKITPCFENGKGANLEFLKTKRGYGSTEFHVLRAKRDASAKYIFYHTQSVAFRKMLEGEMVGTAGQKRVPLAAIMKYPLPLAHSFIEQQAIAEALGEMDALLAAQRVRLAKQRAVKQGLLQGLLSGEKRLPGFAGEWEVVDFPELCWFQEGPGVRKYQFTTFGVKLLNGTNIFKGNVDLDATDKFISEREAYGPYSHFLADEGDIIIACSGIAINKFEEKVAIVKAAHLPLCMNTSTMRFKPDDEKLTRGYLYHYLQSTDFKAHIGGQATGSAQVNFGPSHVKDVKMKLPPLDEQRAIADVLTEADAHLAALEAEHAKTQLLKQGMMQNLLTGKIRLV